MNVPSTPRRWPITPNGPVSVVILLTLGALIFSSAVRARFFLDDHMHASMVDGLAGIRRGAFDIYDFVRGDEWARMRDRGLLPWWTSPKLEIRFLRPLSSLLRVIELKTLGGHQASLVMHVHSLLWWAASVLAVRALFARYLSPRAAFLALWAFALGPWFVLPIGWLANREVLLSIAFGVAGLLAYARYQERGALSSALLALLGFSLAFASGEYALCLGGYVLGACLLEPTQPLARRLLKMWPFVLPALGYLAAHALGGFGTRGSAFYVDPFHEPGKLLRVAPLRLALLLAESWLTLGTEPWGATTPRWAVVCFVLGAATLLILALRRLGLEPRRRAVLSWFLLGSMGAIAPVLAAAPGPRLLSMAAIGIAAVSAILIEEAWFPREGAAPHTLALGLSALGLAFFQLVHGPIASAIAAENLRVTSRVNEGATQALAKKMLAEGPREVIVVRGGGSAFFGPFALSGEHATPTRWRVLTQTIHVLALVRDEHTLELVAADTAPLFPAGATNLFRDEHTPLRAGDVVEVPGMRVEILQAVAAGPTRARYVFDEPLITPGRLWIDENFIGLSPVELPAAGFGAPFDP